MSTDKKLRLAVGVSGAGRSLANLLAQQSELPFEVALVFSSSATAKANELARQNNIPLVVLDFSRVNRERCSQTLYDAFQHHKIDLVVLAGFLKLLPLKESWAGRVINIHPALLPKYGGPGMHGHHVHDAVLQAGEKFSGATVHFVNEKYDDGGIIAQVSVDVRHNETSESLASRIFEAECRLLPAVISAIARGQLPRPTVGVLNSQGGFD